MFANLINNVNNFNGNYNNFNGNNGNGNNKNAAVFFPMNGQPEFIYNWAGPGFYIQFGTIWRKL